MSDAGVWVKLEDAGSIPGAAVIGGATADDPLVPVNKSSFEGDGTNGDLGQAYDVYEFLGSGQLVVDEPGFADLLAVGGGGGGGATQCGGGGSGQFFEYKTITDFGTFPVTVGSGGSGMPSTTGYSGSAGTQSGFSLYWAVGGGEAQGRGEGGGDGGSGAGAGDIGQDAFGVTTAGGQSGGRGGSQCGGGGGGALLPGEDGSDTSTRKGGDGGAGRVSAITETSKLLAGGGGAHGSFDSGQGGAGGGGAGSTAGAGGNGESNTGSGGGAGTAGGNGGSGIVVIRVAVPTMSYALRTNTTAPKTAHAARIEDGVVKQVIVIPHLDNDDNKITEYCNKIGLPGTWVDTSYTGARRGKYAGIGDLFDPRLKNSEFTSPMEEME